MDGHPTHCTFEHHGFAALGPLRFRLTQDDRVAAMTVSIDNSTVVIPLRGVGRLFGIRPNSPDARMLDLVERSLRFVACLELGDPLPLEVVTGEASWEPGPYHRQLASARLQMQLVSWIGGVAGAEEGRVNAQMLLAAIEDPAIRPRVQEALRHAAAELQTDGGGPAVAKLIEELASELSYFESLRERFLDRAKRMESRMNRVGSENGTLAQTRRESLGQVSRLAATGVAQIAGIFDEVEGQTSAIVPALRNLELQRNFLRPHRDRLYSLFLVWSPLLDGWDATPAVQGKESEAFWRMIDEAYRFLAARFMPVQEWQPMANVGERSERDRAVLVW